MKNRFTCLLLCCVFLLSNGVHLYAQTYSPRVEQIRQEIKGLRDDVNKITSLMGYARKVYKEAPDLAKEYARGATVLADRFSAKQKEAYRNRAIIHYTLGEFSEAAKFLGKAASFESGAAGKANLYEKQATAYVRLSKNNQAIAAFEKARRLYLQAGKKEEAVGVKNSVGEVYFKQRSYSEALKAFQSALPLARTLNKPNIIRSLEKNIAACNAILANSSDVEALRIESLEVQEQFESAQAKLEETLEAYQRTSGELEERNEEIMTLQEQQQLMKEKGIQDAKIIELQDEENRTLVIGGSIVVTLSAIIAALGFLLARNRKKKNESLQRKNVEIETEKQRSDNLLLSILPTETADELKNKGIVTPREYQQATLVFTDFVGFTRIAEAMKADRLLHELNYVFAAFDDICERHNLEKIKTIGDAYMAAGGIPIPNATNAVDAVRAAIEMQDFMKKWKTEKEAKGETVWELRIGIHTGKVIAGVIGKTKFAYDVWGDTVNVASRMEATGDPWKVNISRMTYELVQDKFSCTHRGKIPIKHKGPVDMFFVEMPI
ncbi:MAG: adenylate/guanylate cyclase domain-containing protein [Bacteroidia bacterium]